ncbi:methyltransferase family protein [Ruegeria sp.]|uniref:methyltransferase family protein n=1 Tax=Ruegeria sp. TaxID=1879320 RepID=UPI003B5C55FF
MQLKTHNEQQLARSAAPSLSFPSNRGIIRASAQNIPLTEQACNESFRMVKGFLVKNPTFLDTLEKYLLCVIFSVFAYRMVNGYLETGSSVTLLYLGDQFIVLMFVLFRRRTENISTRVDDWLVGFAGTFLALMFGPTGGDAIVSPVVFNGLLIGGLFVHLNAKLTLRRSFGVVAANRGVKATGVYKIVRHPMYTGYMMSQAGLLLAGPTLNNAIVLCLCWSLFLWRIHAEERILSKDPAYAKLARHKLIPGLY